MTKQYQVNCDCGSVTVSMAGMPKVRAFCHCEDCRNLLQVPYHSVLAWDSEHVQIKSGEKHTVEFQHPTLKMKRIFCKNCGETLYNTNTMGWKIVSQLLLRKCNNNEFPEEFESNAHFFYERRIVDIDDQLPKRS